MHLDVDQFPAQSIDSIKLSNSQMNNVRKEISYDVLQECNFQKVVPSDVKERYKFSKYSLDPNKYRFKRVIKIMSFVIKFIRSLQAKVQKKTFSNDETEEAELYYFRIATLEVKKFLNPAKYEKITKEKEGILLYTGRILPTSDVTIVGRMTNAMKDLSIDTFCVPVIERHSPLAYSIVNEVQWHNDVIKHGGIESVWRYVLKKAYIIEGRQLVKSIKSLVTDADFLKRRL